MHQLAISVKGLKYYDAKDKVHRIVNEPLWEWNDLTVDEKEHIVGLVMSYTESQQQAKDKLPTARVYGIICEEFGIACSHPPGVRDYTEWYEMHNFATESKVSPPTKYYMCGACLNRING